MLYLIEHPQLNIGVVTPYRGQVAVIKRLLEARGISLPNRNRVTIGTIHAFQGSESDVFIWDLVDTRDDTIGRLYHSDSGERLGNVAVSRAKGKLVVVGDENAFFEAKGSEKIGKKLKSVFVGLHHGGVVDLEDVFTQA
jgi:superfamily I DNA and/or RNA helicase